MPPPDPNPDTPMRTDMRQIAVLVCAGGVLEAAITGQFLGGLAITLVGAVVLLAAHNRR